MINLATGIHENITVEHTLVYVDEETVHAFIPNKYRKPFDDEDVQLFTSLEAALDWLHETTNTIAPRWPEGYFPRTMRMMRALTPGDPDADPLFHNLRFHEGEEITLAEAHDLFESVENFEEIEVTSQDGEDGANLSMAARLKRLLDTDIKEVINGNAFSPRTDPGVHSIDPDETLVDSGIREPAHRYIAGEHEEVLLDREVASNDAGGPLRATSAQGGDASEVDPDAARGAHGSPHGPLTLEPDPDRPHPRGWPESHTL